MTLVLLDLTLIDELMSGFRELPDHSFASA